MADQQVYIYYRATDALDAAAIAAAVSVLSAEELAQYRRFHAAGDARDYAAAHALLRTTLSIHSEREPAAWRFEKTPAGKPILPASDPSRLSFSLSHSRGMVACAVTREVAVGVDVECVDRDVDAAGIAARFFARSEAAQLDRLDGDARRDRFFDVWTLKEALVKALGTSLPTALDRLAFTVGADGSIALDSSAIAPERWQFGLFAPGSAHRLAVAVQLSNAVPAQLIARSF